MGEYEMKLMDIDQEHLGIPDTVYDAEITLPSAEFARIIRDLKELGESVKIEVSKDGVRFSADGDIGTAAVTLKQTEGRGQADSDEEDEEEDEEEEDAKSEDEEEEDVKPDADGDDDVVIDDVKPDVDGEDSDEPVQSKKKKPAAKKETKKRKAPAKKSSSKKEAKKGKKEKREPNSHAVSIHLQQAVTLTFSIKYLSNFAKSTPLSETVSLHMSNEVPLLVEYQFEQGHIRYYLAPKIAVSLLKIFSAG